MTDEQEISDIFFRYRCGRCVHENAPCNCKLDAIIEAFHLGKRYGKLEMVRYLKKLIMDDKHARVS